MFDVLNQKLLFVLGFENCTEPPAGQAALALAAQGVLASSKKKLLCSSRSSCV